MKSHGNAALSLACPGLTPRLIRIRPDLGPTPRRRRLDSRHPDVAQPGVTDVDRWRASRAVSDTKPQLDGHVCQLTARISLPRWSLS
jgi:hypothetical protein